MRTWSPTTCTLYGEWELGVQLHTRYMVTGSPTTSMIIGIPTNTCYRGHGHLLRPITNTLYKVLKLGHTIYSLYGVWKLRVQLHMRHKGYGNRESNYMRVIWGMRTVSPTTYALYWVWELCPTTYALYGVLELGDQVHTRCTEHENW